jgi:Putative metal-binding motif
MTRIYSGALAVLLLPAAVTSVLAECVNAKCRDTAAIEKARGIIQSSCGCTREGQTHGNYKQCIKSILKLASVTAIIPSKPCRKLIMKCETASICGKLNAAVCCVLRKSGKVKSSIVKSATKCQKGAACGASLGFYSTFDACAADGTCARPTTTNTTTGPSSTTTTTTSATTTTTTTSTTSTSTTSTSTTSATTTTASTTTSTTQPCPGGQILCGTSCVDPTMDADNCGSCGHDCNAGAVHATFTCQSSACVFSSCDPNYWDLDHNGTCEYFCVFQSAQETCNGIDDNCNGQIDEGFAGLGEPCASDDGLPPPGDGACRTFGTYVCSGPNSVHCSATKDLSKAGPEVPDGIDNDCDGLVDETYNDKGPNPTYFVKPAVTQVGASLWIYSYEASRSTATALDPGRGDGWFTSAPPGLTLDQTLPASVQGRLPWFDVTGAEAEQACAAVGGHLCTTAEYQTACGASAACTWGYAPRGTACTTGYTGSKYCNLSPSYDFSPTDAGDQDGLLPAGSPLLQSCSADWSGLPGNSAQTGEIFDLTGNLRELTKLAPGAYALMGGSFLTQVENGAACGFSTFVVDQNFAYRDTGFRCCFTTDPTQ